MGWLSSLFGGGGNNEENQGIQLNLPSYYTSEYYSKPQKELYGFGSGLLKGDIPSYYKSIGEYGGKELESILQSTRGDITGAVSEDIARRNVGGGGVGTAAIAQAMAGVTPQLRWNDYLRSLEGKQYLMGAGIDTLSGVRSAGLSEMGQQNQFNMNTANLEADIAQYNNALEQQEKARKSSQWSNILSSGLGALGTVAGMYLGGPAGGMLGSAAGNKNTDMSKYLTL